MKTHRPIILLVLALCALLPAPCFTAEPHTCVAIKAEPLPSGVAQIWGERGSFWPQRSTLKIRFLSGTTRQKTQAWQRFQQIDELVNLTFVQVTSGPSDIRVRFDLDKGHWSYVGIASRQIASNAATMNLGLVAGVFGDFADEWDRVTLHEMLHALGFEHEHQHPAAGIPWDKAKVYAFYAQTQGWNKRQVDFQVLRRYTGDQFHGSAFDRQSIMLYPVTAEHTTNGFSVGWNRKLSATDIAFIKSVYPAAKTQPKPAP